MKKEATFAVKKMDRRMSGYPFMRYHVEFDTHGAGGNHFMPRHGRLEEFYKVKRWCIEQYGPTRPYNDLVMALDNKMEAEDINTTWTWIRDQFRTKIMFADKEQAAHYALVFGA